MADKKDNVKIQLDDEISAKKIIVRKKITRCNPRKICITTTVILTALLCTYNYNILLGLARALASINVRLDKVSHNQIDLINDVDNLQAIGINPMRPPNGKYLGDQSDESNVNSHQKLSDDSQLQSETNTDKLKDLDIPENDKNSDDEDYEGSTEFSGDSESYYYYYDVIKDFGKDRKRAKRPEQSKLPQNDGSSTTSLKPAQISEAPSSKKVANDQILAFQCQSITTEQDPVNVFSNYNTVSTVDWITNRTEYAYTLGYLPEITILKEFDAKIVIDVPKLRERNEVIPYVELTVNLYQNSRKILNCTISHDDWLWEVWNAPPNCLEVTTRLGFFDTLELKLENYHRWQFKEAADKQIRLFVYDVK